MKQKVKKKRKKKWTTKHTHVKRTPMSKEWRAKQSRFEKILMLVLLILGILYYFFSLLDTHRVGYDSFMGMPIDWMRFVGYDLGR